MDAYTLPRALTRRLGRVARETGALPETLVRDAVKGHLDYLEWLGPSLDEAEREAEQAGWVSTTELRRRLAIATARHPRGKPDAG